MLFSAAFAQTHTIPGHFTKSGKWIPEHQSKQKKSPGQVQADMAGKGRHREQRYIPGHFDKKGHYVKPRTQWVWVKD